MKTVRPRHFILRLVEVVRDEPSAREFNRRKPNINIWIILCNLFLTGQGSKWIFNVAITRNAAHFE